MKNTRESDYPEIQDEAIVCRHCGRDLRTGQPPATAAPAAPAPKKRNKLLIGLVFGLLLLCLCGLVALLVSPPTGGTQVAGAEKAAGSPTPRPLLGMDLSQFVAKYDSLTDIQKKDFVGQSVGKWVDWSGEIDEVRSDGTVLVNIPGTMLSLVELRGVSKDVAKGLNKGQSIRFAGRIGDVSHLVGLYIYLDDVEIK